MNVSHRQFTIRLSRQLLTPTQCTRIRKRRSLFRFLIHGQGVMTCYLLREVNHFLFRIRLSSSYRSYHCLQKNRRRKNRSIINDHMPRILSRFKPTLIGVKHTAKVTNRLTRGRINIIIQNKRLPPLTNSNSLINLLMVLTNKMIINRLDKRNIMYRTLRMINPLRIPYSLRCHFR